MESNYRLNLNSDSLVRDVKNCNCNILRIDIELPVIPDASILLGTIRKIDEISRISNKTIRVYSKKVNPVVEKIFNGLLLNYDNIFYNSEEV